MAGRYYWPIHLASCSCSQYPIKCIKLSIFVPLLSDSESGAGTVLPFGTGSTYLGVWRP